MRNPPFSKFTLQNSQINYENPRQLAIQAAVKLINIRLADDNEEAAN